MIDLGNLPLGFGVALAKNPKALDNFSNMTEYEKEKIVNRAGEIGSRDEMILFINGLGENKFIK